jgi:NADH dehydrogenase FAD-containing subunit
MGPGMLSGIYRPQEIRFHVKKMVQDRGASFIEDSVTQINPETRSLLLKSGKSVHYDLVSFNTGSNVPVAGEGVPGENIYTVKPIMNLLKARHYILQNILKKPLHLCVIGGGPSGVELSGNLWRIVKDNGGDAKITLVAGTRILKNTPEKVRSLALRSLRDRNISVLEGRHVKGYAHGTIVFDDGSIIPFDVAFLATGVKPSSLFRESGLSTGDDGGLLVNAYLQSVRYPELFGGGDCISLQHHRLPKIGVYAVRENPVLHHNLRATLGGRGDLVTFIPQKDYLLVLNMGNGRGIAWRKHFVGEGRLAFMLKDFIDRRFMRKFQVSGELDE